MSDLNMTDIQPVTLVGNSRTLQTFRAAVLTDFQAEIDAVEAVKVLDKCWMSEHGSPYPQDDLPSKLVNKKYRFLCRGNLVHIMNEAAAGRGEHSFGRIPLPALNEVLYALWP